MDKAERHRIAYCASIVVLIAALSSTPYCQHNADTPEWSLPVYEKGCGALMKALHEEWTDADGALVIDVERKLFWALLLDPNAFYEELSPDTIYYGRFSDKLDAKVFRNQNDTTTAHLERLRVVAIERLEDQTYSVDSLNLKYHTEMIETLRRVKVSHVD